MDPILISVAPNGAKKTKKEHANIPLEAKEIAEDAKRCREAGAVLVHLHIRDKNHVHSLDVDTYRRTIDAIRDKVGNDMIIQATSESVDIYEADQQMKMVRALKPEAVSLAVREIIRDRGKDEERASEFFYEIESLGIQPQFILYSPEEVRYFADLRAREKLPKGRKYVLFVLGKKTGSPFDKASFSVPDDLDPFLETFDQGLSLAETDWAVCAFGGNERDCMLKSIACGGHARIGFENNLLMADGSLAPGNAALIRQFVESAKALSPRKIMASAEEARAFLRRKKRAGAAPA
jgi:uncharacterized protein (DUF849 family)